MRRQCGQWSRHGHHRGAWVWLQRGNFLRVLEMYLVCFFTSSDLHTKLMIISQVRMEMMQETMKKSNIYLRVTVSTVLVIVQMPMSSELYLMMTSLRPKLEARRVRLKGQHGRPGLNRTMQTSVSGSPVKLSQMPLESPLAMSEIRSSMGLPLHFSVRIGSSNLYQKTTTAPAISYGSHTCL
jgi:hypothetical protein